MKNKIKGLYPILVIVFMCLGCKESKFIFESNGKFSLMKFEIKDSCMDQKKHSIILGTSGKYESNVLTIFDEYTGFYFDIGETKEYGRPSIYLVERKEVIYYVTRSDISNSKSKNDLKRKEKVFIDFNSSPKAEFYIDGIGLFNNALLEVEEVISSYKNKEENKLLVVKVIRMGHIDPAYNISEFSISKEGIKEIKVKSSCSDKLIVCKPEPLEFFDETKLPF